MTRGPPSSWWCRVAELLAGVSRRTAGAARLPDPQPDRLPDAASGSPWRTSVGVGLIEFIEIYVILTNVPVFGGMTFAQAALVFALANMGFSLADMVFGQFDAMPSHLRTGAARGDAGHDRCR